MRRIGRDQKTKSQSKPASARGVLFGQPQLLDGEDGVIFQELLKSLRAAIKPLDTIEEMFLDDVVSLQWDVLRWRRLKSCLLRTVGHEALKNFLNGRLHYDLYAGNFAQRLAEILQDNIPEALTDGFPERLAVECARNEPKAVDKINKILASVGQDVNHILEMARVDKAEELVQEYTRHKSDVVSNADDFLGDAACIVSKKVFLRPLQMVSTTASADTQSVSLAYRTQRFVRIR
jgi:hypothetical protein